MSRISHSHTRLSGSALQSRVAQFGRRSFIKSIQRGTITLNNVTSATATITTVDPNNTVVHCLAFTAVGAGTDGTMSQMSLVLTNGTTVTAAVNTAEAAAHVIGYEVVEFWPGVLKSLQRGTLTLTGAASATATITAVDLTKSQVISGGYTTTTAVFQHNTIFGRLELTNATTVTFYQPGTVGTWTVPYQILEYY